MAIHKSVLLPETIEALNLKNGDIVVDATLGGGGHSCEILRKILPDGKLIVFDQDEKAIIQFRKIIEVDWKIKNYKKEQIILINENFENIAEVLKSRGINKINAIMADLGISSDQLADRELGISFQIDAPLDMRLDRKRDLTARKIINEYAENELVKIFQDFSEEKYARRIARNIVEERKIRDIQTTKELVLIIENSVPVIYRRGKIHCATKVFQALRMEVNQELESLGRMIVDGVRLLSSQGRMAIITFHSGEDRLVKELFRKYARGCVCPAEFPVCRCGKKEIVKIITKKALKASKNELSDNLRARSASLRVIEKI